MIDTGNIGRFIADTERVDIHNLHWVLAHLQFDWLPSSGILGHPASIINNIAPKPFLDIEKLSATRIARYQLICNSISWNN